jgi:predicted secreted hydrolase
MKTSVAKFISFLFQTHARKLSFRAKRGICFFPLSSKILAFRLFSSSSLRPLCSLCLILSLIPSTPSQSTPTYELALPGYHFSFPHDHFSHPSYQTEWWYYTGNLQSSDGHRFGFELTFFRQAIHRAPSSNSSWDVQDLYLAHLALSDLDAGRFYHAERTNRSGPGIAGVSEPVHRIWNGNWQILFHDPDDQRLQAISDQFELRFHLHSEKPPILHGEKGLSQKSDGPGRASHYISLTRLTTTGEILLNGKRYQINGLSWMDHEFFSHQLDPSQVGWDWLSIQLDDHTELMLFHIRRKDGSIDPHSAGTYIDAQGQSTHLRAADFTLEPISATFSDQWTSPASHATYPIRWQIAIPKLGIALEAKTPLPSQELTSASKLSPTYWEGAVTLSGQRNPQSSTGSPNPQPLSGSGYLEMTGYDRPLTLAP